MSPIAATLEKEDMLPLATYFSEPEMAESAGSPQRRMTSPPRPRPRSASVGCIGCHLDHFQGDGTTARLAGQWQDYLNKTMTDFRTGTRGNNPGMSDLMNATSPDDSRRSSQYLAGMQIDQYLNQGR